MEYVWHYEGQPEKLGHFLQQMGLSRMQLKRLKYQGGFVFVNKRRRNTAFLIRQGDTIFLKMAPEREADAVKPFDAPLAIAYEDQDYLVVNKPAGVASIPDVAKGPDTMANRVKAYLIKTHAESLAIHVVTRLDRDTSGLMLFAKHSFAHSLMDRQLHTSNMVKQYTAIVTNWRPLPPHGWIVLPIGRTREFYMRRGVNLLAGKHSVTEYWVQEANDQAAKVLVTLHTGRTHQIRVHFSALGHPLFGDELYGGPHRLIDRQALHCSHLRFWQPLAQKQIDLIAALPPDMVELARQLKLE